MWGELFFHNTNITVTGKDNTNEHGLCLNEFITYQVLKNRANVRLCLSCPPQKSRNKHQFTLASYRNINTCIRVHTQGEIYSPNLSSADFVHDSLPMPHRCAYLRCFSESAEKCHLPWPRGNQKNLDTWPLTSSSPAEERNTDHHPGHLKKVLFKATKTTTLLRKAKRHLFSHAGHKSCWCHWIYVPLFECTYWDVPIKDSWQQFAGHKIFCLFTWGSFINLSNTFLIIALNANEYFFSLAYSPF